MSEVSVIPERMPPAMVHFEHPDADMAAGFSALYFLARGGTVDAFNARFRDIEEEINITRRERLAVDATMIETDTFPYITTVPYLGEQLTDIDPANPLGPSSEPGQDETPIEPEPNLPIVTERPEERLDPESAHAPQTDEPEVIRREAIPVRADEYTRYNKKQGPVRGFLREVNRRFPKKGMARIAAALGATAGLVTYGAIVRNSVGDLAMPSGPDTIARIMDGVNPGMNSIETFGGISGMAGIIATTALGIHALRQRKANRLPRAPLTTLTDPTPEPRAKSLRERYTPQLAIAAGAAALTAIAITGLHNHEPTITDKAVTASDIILGLTLATIPARTAASRVGSRVRRLAHKSRTPTNRVPLETLLMEIPYEEDVHYPGLDN